MAEYGLTVKKLQTAVKRGLEIDDLRYSLQ